MECEDFHENIVEEGKDSRILHIEIKGCTNLAQARETIWAKMWFFMLSIELKVEEERKKRSMNDVKFRNFKVEVEAAAENKMAARATVTQGCATNHENKCKRLPTRSSRRSSRSMKHSSKNKPRRRRRKRKPKKRQQTSRSTMC